MRYRRLSYRYAVVLGSGGLPSGARTPGDPWRTDRQQVTLAQPSWCPPADVYESQSTVTVTIELAGVDQDQLEALLFQDAVVVEGQRRLPPAEGGGVYHAAQIRQGPFRLEVPLPVPIDPDQVEAHYDGGLLRITFVKADRRQPGW